MEKHNLDVILKDISETNIIDLCITFPNFDERGGFRSSMNSTLDEWKTARNKPYADARNKTIKYDANELIMEFHIGHHQKRLASIIMIQWQKWNQIELERFVANIFSAANKLQNLFLYLGTPDNRPKIKFSVAESLNTVKNLHELSINGFSNLPIEGIIANNKDLTYLSLIDTQLEYIPTNVLELKKLKILDLRDNSLPIPSEILAKTNKPQVILNYYFEHFKKPLNEVKLLFVGQGSVGKTSLVRKIIHNTFDQNQSKTEGISIEQLIIKSKTEVVNQASKIKLNIWDFGGQEIMHATHQFFLTKRSLYLLVLDSRLTQEENRVEYWLKIIQSFGGESPVLIVGNKTDQHSLDIDRTGLQKKYPNIVGILETSAATGAGIEALKAEIAK